MSGRGILVGLASVLGSFVVYGAHLACGGGAIGRGVTSAPAQTTSATVAISAPSTTTCGCPSAPPATTITAAFSVAGDEKMTLDPMDSTAQLDVSFTRGAAGKKVATVIAVVRAYRTDQPAERPTTLGIRVVVPEAGGAPADPKDLEAYVLTWAGTAPAGRAYASVGKSALTVSMAQDAIEVRGSLTLKDPPTGKSVTIDKLSIRKTGASLLPSRTGAWATP